MSSISSFEMPSHRGGQKKKISDSRLAVLINAPLIVLFLGLPVERVYEYFWVGFLVQLVCGLLILYFGSDRKISNLFAPSVTTFIYFGVSFSLGSYCVANGITLKKTALLPSAMGFDNSIHWIVLMTMGGQALLLFAAVKGAMDRAAALGSEAKVSKKRDSRIAVVILSLTVFIAFSFLPFDLSLFGGSGSFSYPLRLSAAIALYTCSLRLPLAVRVGLFMVVLGASALQGYQSKREIVFIIIAALMIEMTWRGWKVRFSLKEILLGGVVVFGFAVIVLWSSILRGYGGYNYKSPVDAFTYIPIYVNESWFLAAANENFELSHVFGNTSKCIDIVHDGDIPYQYGATLGKVLFVPIPRSLFPYKPKSMIEIYTSTVAPGLHRNGVSIPVTLFGELFTNFHAFGLVLVYPIFRILDYFYCRFVVLIRRETFNLTYYVSAFLCATTVQFARGSGLEIHLIYVLVAMPFMYAYAMVGESSRKKKKVVPAQLSAYQR